MRSPGMSSTALNGAPLMGSGCPCARPAGSVFAQVMTAFTFALSLARAVTSSQKCVRSSTDFALSPRR